jgi:transcription elongation factor Elf1
MKIKTILNQSRRDFNAIYECEHCNHEEKGSGYDDAFFHNEVIPSMVCKSCGKKASDEYRPLAPKYSQSTVI